MSGRVRNEHLRRIARRLNGRPARPAPFVYLAEFDAVAWDPERELPVTLPRAETQLVPGALHQPEVDALRPDGRYLRLDAQPAPTTSQAGPYQAVYDICTGAVRIEDRVFYSTFGPEVGPTVRVPLSRGSTGGHEPTMQLFAAGTTVPIDVPLPGALRGTVGGVPVQFSPGHSKIAASTSSLDMIATTVIDISAGLTRTYQGLLLAGTSSWSPDGRSLIVVGLAGRIPQTKSPMVLDLLSGQTHPLDLQQDRHHPHPRQADNARVVGWVDRDHVLVTQSDTSRLILSALHQQTGEVTWLLDLPARRSAGAETKVMVAADVPWPREIIPSSSP